MHLASLLLSAATWHHIGDGAAAMAAGAALLLPGAVRVALSAVAILGGAYWIGSVFA